MNPPEEADQVSVPPARVPGRLGGVPIREPREVRMPTKAAEDSDQLRKKAAVVDDIRTRLEGADAAVLTEYRGLSVTDLADLRATLRPAATDYKVFKNTLARRAADEAGLTDVGGLLVGPVGDRVRAPRRRRRGHRREGVARLRPHEPEPGAEGRPARRPGAQPGGRRGTGRRPAARTAARPPGRRLPGAAHEGGRACSRRSPATSPTASRR